MAELARILLLYGLAVALVALAAALLVRARARRSVGRVLVARRGARAARALLAVTALALGAAALFGEHELGAVCALLALVTAGVALIAPAEADRVCGEAGLRAGWEALAYGELAEWRLTGDHLRFRGAGVWSAVDAPRALHEELRAVLESRCPGRESRFRD